jgi:hypothetical protein
MRNVDFGMKNHDRTPFFNAEFGMRPEQCKVQGSPALYVVQGGFRIGKTQSPSLFKK